jgi:hypothetical protein
MPEWLCRVFELATRVINETTKTDKKEVESKALTFFDNNQNELDYVRKGYSLNLVIRSSLDNYKVDTLE